MIPQEKHRITFVVSGLSPTLGLERVTLSLLDVLDAEFDIHVICIGGSYTDKSLHNNVEVLGTPLTGLQRIRSVPRLYARSRHSGLGTVVLVGVWTAIPWLMIAPRRAAGTIVWEHTLLQEKLAKSRQLHLLKLMSRWLYQRADCVVGVSTPVTDDIAEYGNVRWLETIPNLVETPTRVEIQESLRTKVTDPYRIVCVGSLSSIKSQDLAIKAMALLDDKYSLTLIGAGPRMQALKDMATELGVQDRVHFTGHLARDQVMENLRAAALLLHCSVAETFGLVYVEAADLGIPVLSVSTRAARQLIPAYVPGWLCENDAASIAATIRRVASLPKPSDEAYVGAASRRAQEFGAIRVRDAWREILKHVGAFTNQERQHIPAAQAEK
ncbi:glycosyltransferase [Arthrobacter sp. PAMC25564]|uniref:glycosyltransferase n=1 Tax=Arthrobacter sp. PAMC25564 TaxID=2565366 RepID=UPI00144619C7|nr:glycosyltransferase [Arthrobacter sp. PAMC25564]